LTFTFLIAGFAAEVRDHPLGAGGAGRVKYGRPGFEKRRMTMSRRQWTSGWILALAVATTAHGTTFFVDAGQGDNAHSGRAATEPFLTIQWAINAAAAQPGTDLIQLAAGEYYENLAIRDPDGLTLSGGRGVALVAADSSDDVIEITWGDVSISNLSVTDGNRGIALTGSAGMPVSLSLRDVVLTANSGDAVRGTNVASVRVSQCMFLDNGGTGLRIEGANSITVSDCGLNGNTGRGLRIEDGRSVTISQCEILNNSDDGMKVVTSTLDRTQSDLSISDTRIAGSADDAIDLEGLGHIRLTNVTVEDIIGDDGMSIDDSLSVSVTDSSFTNSHADGLDIDDTLSIQLVNVTSTGSGASGLQVTAEGDANVESLSIVGSTFSDNGLDGIWVREDGTHVEQVSLTSVTADDNGASGWDILVSGEVRLNAVTSEGNDEPDVP
jgi:parallel beta-helix repeat protein